MKDSKSRILGKIGEVFGGESYRRILLINPPQFPDAQSLNIDIVKKQRYYNYPPYGLGLLCAKLNLKGYESSILDLNFDLLEYIFKEDETTVIEGLEPFWKKRIREEIEEFRPDVIGLTCMFTMSHEITKHVAKHIKDIFPGLPIIGGGVHITNAAEIVLKEIGDIDFISLFEGDQSFLDFMEYVNREEEAEKLSQIGTLIEGQYLTVSDRISPRINDIDIIPDYKELRIRDYYALGEIGNFRYWLPEDSKNSSVLSNRGCRGRCSFCSVRNFNGKSVRARSVESVLDEIQKLKEVDNISHITWLDDDLFFDHKRTVKLFNGIVQRGLGITWDAMNGIIASAMVLHPETVEAAVESGMIAANIGVESGNSTILGSVHKPSSVDHCRKVGEMMKRYPQVYVRAFIIIGFPHETLGMMLDTINLCREMDFDWNAIQKLTPLPSTEIYDQMVDEGFIEKDSLNTNSGYSLFSVREGEKQRKREEEGRLDSSSFYDYFSSNLNHVPTLEELDDIWLLMDYKVNYEKILFQTDEKKLKKMQRFLTSVVTRMTVNNPLASLFLGVVEHKLGNVEKARYHARVSKGYLDSSDYWQKSFSVFGVDHIYSELLD